MFSHFDSLGVLLNAESCFLNKFGCRYSYESLSSVPQKPHYFTERYLDVKKVLVETFYGPPKEGVYSPSVQNTLYVMAKSVLNRSLSLSLCGAHTQIHVHTHAGQILFSTSMLIYLHPTHTRTHTVRNTHMHDAYADTSIQAQVHACINILALIHILLFLWCNGFRLILDFILFIYFFHASRFLDISSIQLKMPNIHFLPVNLKNKDNQTIVKV
jgi:hypothetical protein